MTRLVRAYALLLCYLATIGSLIGAEFVWLR